MVHPKARTSLGDIYSTQAFPVRSDESRGCLKTSLKVQPSTGHHPEFGARLISQRLDHASAIPTCLNTAIADLLRAFDPANLVTAAQAAAVRRQPRPNVDPKVRGTAQASAKAHNLHSTLACSFVDVIAKPSSQTLSVMSYRPATSIRASEPLTKKFSGRTSSAGPQRDTASMAS